MQDLRKEALAWRSQLREGVLELAVLLLLRRSRSYGLGEETNCPGPETTVGAHAVIEGDTTIGRVNRVFQFAAMGAIPRSSSAPASPRHAPHVLAPRPSDRGGQAREATTGPRFDLPAIGARTIEVIAAVKGATPAVEAGRTVVLESAEVARRADAAGVALSSPDE